MNYPQPEGEDNCTYNCDTNRSGFKLHWLSCNIDH